MKLATPRTYWGTVCGYGGSAQNVLGYSVRIWWVCSERTGVQCADMVGLLRTYWGTVCGYGGSAQNVLGYSVRIWWVCSERTGVQCADKNGLHQNTLRYIKMCRVHTTDMISKIIENIVLI